MPLSFFLVPFRYLSIQGASHASLVFHAVLSDYDSMLTRQTLYKGLNACLVQ